ncbi:hypothetical protein [Lysobacter firmicutimachus]|uniref:DUF4194 domain-containing protein n=1 Tax=Lysobacter firmicutimachus TaxID=1792846 RepID=A0ABU8CZQ4_9GAMM
MNDPIASLIARLLAERWLPRDDAAVRELLTDAELRNDLDRRLAAAGLRLLEHPYAANVAVGIARPQESAAFGSAKAWSATNLQLDRDAIALLVVLWALLVLPKRQRQIARQQADRDQDQEQMFAELKPIPVGAEVVEPINERTLLADFGEKLGGKTRIQFNLGSLARQGFITRRKERIHEGPLLDLAFDYERIAGRVMDGALSFVVTEARQHANEQALLDAAAGLDGDAEDEAAAAAIRVGAYVGDEEAAFAALAAAAAAAETDAALDRAAAAVAEDETEAGDDLDDATGAVPSGDEAAAESAPTATTDAGGDDPDHGDAHRASAGTQTQLDQEAAADV